MMTFKRITIAGVLGLLGVGSVGCGDDDMTSMTDSAGPQEPPEPDPPPPPPPEGYYKIHCFSDDTANYFWRGTPSVPIKDSARLIDPCVHLDFSDPDWELEARAGCSAYCDSLNQDYIGTPECLDGGWTAVQPWSPYKACPDTTPQFDPGPVEQELGEDEAEMMLKLGCDLPSTCLDELDYDARLAMVTPPTANTRFTADSLVETDPTVASSFTLVSSSVNVTGTAAYTADSCSDPACVFYLSQLQLASPTAFNVQVPYGAAPITKTLTGLTLRIAEPSLGLWLPSTGDVIFPPNSLELRVDVTVSGTSNVFNENGTHRRHYLVGEYVFGTLSNGVLTLHHDGSDMLGAWAVDAQFVPE